ncbi:MAG: pyridoxine 5'-phosphate synthase [Bacteroidales bacterium]|jgi:pyridoxine 5-phosphate synthase|nr:pyridoxine 5'-phosphate synthase [Bacteroidales bacterium]MBQ1842215.1 pyridoxine 5'-phosphate synthase [Bacteroidales bacterium]MBQ2549975.1 pyridoxine 5'-phosphate synthase [Bacteroidales bacterium]
MTRLSVNINKIATIRNARGGNLPDVALAARRCEEFGAQGITVHPRPDERHIRYSDVREIRPNIKTEFNIEGNPIDSFIDLVLEVVPDQVTLVPDAPDAITSNAGWDTIKNRSFLTDICKEFKSKGIRTSIFIDPDPFMAEGAAICGADRVELYTADYAREYYLDPEIAIARYFETAKAARSAGLGLNAGHDLNLDNLNYFIRTIPWTDEVSIGHALISDALYLGLEKTIKAYLAEINKK